MPRLQSSADTTEDLSRPRLQRYEEWLTVVANSCKITSNQIIQDNLDLREVATTAVKSVHVNAEVDYWLRVWDTGTDRQTVKRTRTRFLPYMLSKIITPCVRQCPGLGNNTTCNNTVLDLREVYKSLRGLKKTIPLPPSLERSTLLLHLFCDLGIRANKDLAVARRTAAEYSNAV